MKHNFTLFIVVLFFKANSQTYPSFNKFYNEMPTLGEMRDSAIAANNYHSMTRTYTRYNKKGKAKRKAEISSFKYNDKGYMISFEESNTRNKNNERYEYFIIDSTLFKYDYYRNNKLKKSYEVKRKGQRVIDAFIKNSKGEIISRKHHEFDPRLNLISRVAEYDKNDKEKYAIEYTYYDAKTLKQAREYRKGKLKKVWNYTCDPAGQKEKAKEVKVCKNVNVDENGNRVESNRIVAPNGDVELRVNTFDKNDRMIRQKIYDDIRHRLKSEWSSSLVHGNIEKIYKIYNKKGKEVYSNKTVFMNEYQMLSNEYVFGSKKKNTFKTIFQYNEKKLITHSESFGKKNRKVSENIHTYN